MVDDQCGCQRISAVRCHPFELSRMDTNMYGLLTFLYLLLPLGADKYIQIWTLTHEHGKAIMEYDLGADILVCLIGQMVRTCVKNLSAHVRIGFPIQ